MTIWRAGAGSSSPYKLCLILILTSHILHLAPRSVLDRSRKAVGSSKPEPRHWNSDSSSISVSNWYSKSHPCPTSILKFERSIFCSSYFYIVKADCVTQWATSLKLTYTASVSYLKSNSMYTLVWVGFEVKRKSKTRFESRSKPKSQLSLWSQNADLTVYIRN